MNTIIGLVRAALVVATAVVTAVPTPALSKSTNPLLSAPMPKCGPSNRQFQRLLKDLKQRHSWRGKHENLAGELELTVGRNGSWFLFYHSRDNRERDLVCLIARGSSSRETFGNPV